MSIGLPLTDLSSAVVGSTGQVLLSTVGIGLGGVDANPAFTNNPAHLNIFNDSKCTLAISFLQSGSNDILQPGAWRTYNLVPGEAGFKWQVLSLMNVNAPISQLSAVYYAPGEPVNSPGTLGNSPIGGGVNTSSVQTLSNEGGAAGLLVIDMGPASPGQVVSIWNDHFIWSVVQATVAHQVLKGQTSGNPLQVGQAGDIAEFLGQILVDQLATFTGNIVANGGMNTNTIRDDVNGNAAEDLSAGDGTVAFPQIIKPNKSPTVTNGSVAGTLSFSTPFWGNAIKVAYIEMAGFNSASAVTCIFPSSVARSFMYVGALGGTTGTVQPQLTGTNVQFVQLTALGTLGAAGSASATTNAHQFNIGEIESTIDRLVVSTVSGIAVQGVILLIGLG